MYPTIPYRTHLYINQIECVGNSPSYNTGSLFIALHVCSSSCTDTLLNEIIVAVKINQMNTTKYYCVTDFLNQNVSHYLFREIFINQ